MKVIYGVDELDEFITENYEDKTIMLYFGAEWCGPCKLLKKKLSDPETNKEVPKLVTAYLDVDEITNEKLVNRYKVSSLPTQIFITLDDKFKVVELGRVVGFNYDKLLETYNTINNL